MAWVTVTWTMNVQFLVSSTEHVTQQCQWRCVNNWENNRGSRLCCLRCSFGPGHGAVAPRGVHYKQKYVAFVRSFSVPSVINKIHYGHTSVDLVHSAYIVDAHVV